MTKPRAQFVELITALDHEGIESARGLVTEADVPALTAWYRELDAWPQKLALVDLICDQNHPSMEAVLLDALQAPGSGDWVDLPKAFALGWLDDALDDFAAYYNDRAHLRHTVDAFLAQRGLTRQAEAPAPEKPRVDLPEAPEARLFVAAAAGENDEVKRLLAAGVSPNAKHGDPALVAALMRKNFDGALLLIEAGADPNTRRETANQTALEWAAFEGAVDVLDAMISRGADVNAGDDWGSTALKSAAARGHVEAVRRLLAAGADVHKTISDGRTILNLAVRGGKPEILGLLLDAGADLQSKQPTFTPLAFACFEGNAAMVELLLGRGADPDARISYGSFVEATPLMLAASGGKVKMVQHLVAARADVKAKDAKGMTAADYAKGRRADRVRELLGE